jgi:plastocyanin
MTFPRILVRVGGAALIVGAMSFAPATSYADQSAQIVETANAGQPYAFQPAPVTAKVGEQVQWTNTSKVAHTVTSADGSLDSAILASGETFTWTPSAAGTITYYCSFHRWMTGTVVVGS